MASDDGKPRFWWEWITGSFSLLLQLFVTSDPVPVDDGAEAISALDDLAGWDIYFAELIDWLDRHESDNWTKLSSLMVPVAVGTYRSLYRRPVASAMRQL